MWILNALHIKITTCTIETRLRAVCLYCVGAALITMYAYFYIFFFNEDKLPIIKYAFLLYRGATIIEKNSLHKEGLNKYFIS